jgi:hypothetical protein
MLELSASRHPGIGTTVLSGTTGLAYTIDVLEWVPYVALLGGAYHLPGTTAPGGAFAVGLDYQMSRAFAVGVQGRWHEIFAPDPLGTTSYLTAFARAEYVWGF